MQIEISTRKKVYSKLEVSDRADSATTLLEISEEDFKQKSRLVSVWTQTNPAKVKRIPRKVTNMTPKKYSKSRIILSVEKETHSKTNLSPQPTKPPTMILSPKLKNSALIKPSLIDETPGGLFLSDAFIKYLALSTPSTPIPLLPVAPQWKIHQKTPSMLGLPYIA